MRIFFIALIMLGSTLSQPAIARDLTDLERAVIADAVKAKLKDPESASFRWMPLVDPPADRYCGLVNAKNSYGGYTGFTPYLGVLLFDEDVLRGMVVMGIDNDATATVCVQSGYWNLHLAE